MHETKVAALEELASRIDQSSNIFNSLSGLTAADNSKIDASQTIPNADASINDLQAATLAIVSFTGQLKSVRDWSLIPAGWIQHLITNLIDLARFYDVLTSTVSGHIANPSTITSINPGDFVLSIQNSGNIDLRPQLAEIAGKISGALEAHYQLRTITKASRLTDFSEIVRGLSSAQSEANNLAREFKAARTELERDRATLKAAITEVQGASQEITRMQQEATNDRKTITEYVGEGTQKIEAARELAREADTLRASVNEYQASFDSFKQQLDARNTDYAKQRTQLEAMTSTLSVQQLSIQELIDRSEEMLKGATTAGLAFSFSERQKEINGEVEKSRVAFNWSIVFLIILSLPVATYFIPKEFYALIVPANVFARIEPLLNSGVERTPEYVLTHLLARAVFLVPGIWLTRVAGRRYERLFKLREHYAHKYSIASSVEGFKKQTPDYDQEVAAAAFLEITANPSSIMTGHGEDGRHPNKAVDWMMDKIEGRRKQKNTPGRHSPPTRLVHISGHDAGDTLDPVGE